MDLFCGGKGSLRVADLVIGSNTFDDIASSNQVVMLWQVLDVVTPSEKRNGAGDNGNIPPSTPPRAAPAAALTKIDVEFPYSYGPDAPIIGPLATRYPALTRSLQILSIVANVYDESDALDTFAALATHLRALTLWRCGLTSLEALAGRCEFLRKINICDCQHLCSLDGMADHVYLEEVDASLTAVTSVDPLGTCPALTIVVLYGCRRLGSIAGLGGLLLLQEVNASFTSISTLQPLCACPALKKVDVTGCRQLPVPVELPDCVAVTGPCSSSTTSDDE